MTNTELETSVETENDTSLQIASSVHPFSSRKKEVMDAVVVVVLVFVVAVVREEKDEEVEKELIA